MTALPRAFAAFVTLAAASLSAAAEGDWEPLFEGASLGDFYLDFEEEANPEEIFQIAEDGALAIKAKGRPAGFIQTLDEYGDYELELEWRWPEEPRKPGQPAPPPPAKPAKSGLLLHCSDARYYGVWPRCIEVRIERGSVGDIWLFGETVEVADEKQIPPKASESRRRLKLLDAERKPGQWNQMRIVAKGGAIEIHLNGKLVNKASNASAKSGYIAIQAEGYDLELRGVRIRQLD